MKSQNFFTSFILLLAVLPLLSPLNAALSDPEGVFAEANAHYAAKDYAGAIQQYETLVDNAHTTAAVHFNLGNAYFKQGDTGPAIYHYLKAQALAPSDPDTAANLRFVRDFKEVPAIQRPWWQVWALQLHVDAWFWLASGSFWLAVASIVLLPLWKPLVTIRWPGAVFGGLCLLLSLPGLAGYHFMANEVVILPGEVRLRAAPARESPGSDKAKGGEIANILEDKGDYLLVSMDGGKRSGWLLSEEAGKVWD